MRCPGHDPLSSLVCTRGLMGLFTPLGVTFLSAKKDLELRKSRFSFAKPSAISPRQLNFKLHLR